MKTQYEIVYSETAESKKETIEKIAENIWVVNKGKATITFYPDLDHALREKYPAYDFCIYKREHNKARDYILICFYDENKLKLRYTIINNQYASLYQKNINGDTLDGLIQIAESFKNTVENLNENRLLFLTGTVKYL